HLHRAHGTRPARRAEAARVGRRPAAVVAPLHEEPAVGGGGPVRLRGGVDLRSVGAHDEASRRGARSRRNPSPRAATSSRRTLPAAFWGKSSVQNTTSSGSFHLARPAPTSTSPIVARSPSEAGSTPASRSTATAS